jgi:hypothetical protein
VGTRARIVADPDAKVLDLEGVLLVDLNRSQPWEQARSRDRLEVVVAYLVQANDLAVGLLDLPQLHEEIPETGLGDDIVRRKNPHAVQLGRGVSVGGQVTPNDLVLVETTCSRNVSISDPRLCLHLQRPQSNSARVSSQGRSRIRE